MGAWIETQQSCHLGLGHAVAPCVGAWIETSAGLQELGPVESLPAWERGLKLCPLDQVLHSLIVAPCVGAWIETLHLSDEGYTKLSLPAWERGLKLAAEQTAQTEQVSLPAWERGLKPSLC